MAEIGFGLKMLDSLEWYSVANGVNTGKDINISMIGKDYSTMSISFRPKAVEKIGADRFSFALFADLLLFRPLETGYKITIKKEKHNGYAQIRCSEDVAQQLKGFIGEHDLIKDDATGLWFIRRNK